MILSILIRHQASKLLTQLSEIGLLQRSFDCLLVAMVGVWWKTRGRADNGRIMSRTILVSPSLFALLLCLVGNHGYRFIADVYETG